MAIPIFLEKLMAGTPVTKACPTRSAVYDVSDNRATPQRDVLQTMTLCIPVYGAAVARANSRKMWNALKLEVNFFGRISDIYPLFADFPFTHSRYSNPPTT